jgi:hypothetical protein
MNAQHLSIDELGAVGCRAALRLLFGIASSPWLFRG